jgi:hypothetical protein
MTTYPSCRADDIGRVQMRSKVFFSTLLDALEHD